MRRASIPPIVAEALAKRLHEVAPEERIWPGLITNGSRWCREVWDPAVSAIGRPGFHFHDLRHTAISLAIGSGADAKVVQAMAGHASLAMTLGRYGHLLQQSSATVAERMSVLFEENDTA